MGTVASMRLAADRGQTQKSGFDLTPYRPEGTPDDGRAKSILVLFSLALMLYPLLFAAAGWAVGRFADNMVAFVIGGAFLIVFNVIYVYYLLSSLINPLRSDWKAASAKITNLDKVVACEGVRDTLYAFRYLLKWRRFIRQSSVPFTVGYIAVVGYVAAAAFGLAGDPLALKPLQYWPLVYYGVVFLIRTWAQGAMLRPTENLDPTVQICTALVELHERWQDAAGGGRRAAAQPNLRASAGVP